MIKVDKLNNKTYDDIVNQARLKISQYSNEWNNLQEYDPGVTLVEMFSYLKTLQDERIDEISRLSYGTFFDLMQLKRETNVGAKTLLSLSGNEKDVIIPSGTKWFAGSMIFENERVCQISSAKIEKIIFETKKGQQDISYDCFVGGRLFYVFGDVDDCETMRSSMTICFDKPLLKNKEHSFYVQIAGEGLNRNPLGDYDDFYELADVCWEFYGNVDGKVDWHELKITEDQTHRFLFSGFVRFKFSGDMVCNDGVYKIRVRLVNEEYDIFPQISGFKVNVIEVQQKDTLCESIKVCKKDIDSSGCVRIWNNLALYGQIVVYMKNADLSWRQVENVDCIKNVEEGYAELCFHKVIGDLPDVDDEEVFLVVMQDQVLDANLNGKGFSPQKFDINIDYSLSERFKCNQKIYEIVSDFKVKKNQLKDYIMYDSFDLIVGEGVDKSSEKFYPFEKVETFVSSGKCDRHYMLSCIGSAILFGDNSKGRAPQNGIENVRIVGMSLTKGKATNIKTGLIKNVSSENVEINKLSVDQFVPASDGRDMELFEDMKKHLLRSLNNGNRLVTVEDYENAVRNTPGLFIKRLKVLPGFSPHPVKDEFKCVTIVAQSLRNEKKLLKGYEKNIYRYIEKYRLINTKVIVTSPVYLKVDVSCNVVINPYYCEHKRLIKESIENFICELNNSYGQNLYFAELFGTLDKLDCVLYVKSLNITPVGSFKEHTSSGDVIANPNGVYTLGNVDVLCTIYENF